VDKQKDMKDKMYNVHFKGGQSITVDGITKSEILRDIKAMNGISHKVFVFAEYVDGLLTMNLLEVSHIVVAP
jgi:hypothetical protein